MLQITVKLTEELEVYIKDGIVQNNPGELDEWYGEEVTRKVNLSEVLKATSKLPDGDYKLTLTLEKL